MFRTSVHSRLLPASTAGHRPTPSRLVVRAMREMDTDRRAIVPQAPPVFTPPPPPPPPTPPVDERGEWRPSRRALFGVLMGGGLAAYGLQKTVLSEAPSILRSEDGGFFLKSQRGNVVRIFSDKMGRLWFLDQGGNFYYDTDIPGAGFYCYTREGRIYNLYEDRDGNPQASFVGSVEDLVTIESRELGYITAFEDGRRIYLPPDARTAQIDPDTGGVRFTPPPLLEEGYLGLERRFSLLEGLLPSKGKEDFSLESFRRGEP